MFDAPIDVLMYRDLEVRQLGRQVELAIQQLRVGDFRAADACKLRGTALYRARLDDRNRLLFKFGEQGGRRVLLILEVVHNHDYTRSRFLGGGAVSEADFEPVPMARLDGSAWLDQRGVKAAAFAQVWELLATAPLKVKLGDRMVKLDPTTGEWFLVQLGLVQLRRIVDGAARQGALPLVDAPAMARLVASLPPTVLPAYRRRREYLSSILAKNEMGSTNPYGRRLFQRVRRGAYVLCPALEVEVKGEWVPVGPEAEPIARWMAEARAALVPPAAPEEEVETIATNRGPGATSTAIRRSPPGPSTCAATEPPIIATAG